MDPRVQRERNFHNDRFRSNPTRSEKLRGMTNSITLEALAIAYSKIEQYSRDACVLDYGCAQGESSFIINKYGPKSVHAIDISDVAVAQAREELSQRGIKNIKFDVMDAEDMDFPSSTFDLVCGFGILHHLDLDKSLGEIARVLKPTGRAVFLEPLGHNPAINLFRKLTPSIRTPDEHPLLMKDLRHINMYFSDVEAIYLNLATLATVPFGNLPGHATIQRGLATLDRGLFAAVPILRRFAWNVVLDIGQPLDK